MDFADKIKLIKTEFLNMNSANLAKKLNISRTSLYNWEIGISKASIENIKTMSIITGFSTDCLLKDDYHLTLSLFGIDDQAYKILHNLIKYFEEKNLEK